LVVCIKVANTIYKCIEAIYYFLIFYLNNILNINQKLPSRASFQGKNTISLKHFHLRNAHKIFLQIVSPEKLNKFFANISLKHCKTFLEGTLLN